jgi:hypothetical protein
MRSFSLGRVAPAWAILFSLALPALSWAETRRESRKYDEAPSVDLFEAVKSGEIEVRVIAKDAAGGNVLIENKTNKPLAIKLPEVFAAVPVAAQFGPLGRAGGIGAGDVFGQNANGNQAGGAANQPLGGGFNQQGGAGFPGGNVGFNGPGNFNGGVFKVEPEKARKLKITTVCLAHGWPDPNPHVAYELKPTDSYTENANTIETVKMLARGEIDQKIAQAVAWHFENGMSWDQLAKKVAARHLNGRSDPFFSRDQIARGKKIAAEAERRGKDDWESSAESSLATTK